MGLSPVLVQGHGFESCLGQGNGLRPVLVQGHRFESYLTFSLICLIFLSMGVLSQFCPCYYFLFFSPLSLLHSQVSSIVKALHKQLKDKSIKTRQVCIVQYIYIHVHTYTCTYIHVHTVHVHIYMYQCSPQSREAGCCAPLFFQAPCYQCYAPRFKNH